MRAVVITKAASPVAPNIKLVEDWPEPIGPAPGQVLVKTLASALNHLDLWVGMGVPGLALSYPRVSGSDACGVVEAVGEGVDGTWVGKRVILNAALPVEPGPKPAEPPGNPATPDYQLIGEHHHGALAAKFLAPVANLAQVRDDQDPSEAAAYGLTFLTAYSMMVTKGQLRAGETVLITGIGGGVALAALTIARHVGCPIAVTSRHQWKLDRAKELGAELALLDHGEDWSKQVREWSGKRGVDLAVDSSGKATHMKCIKSLARGGAYLTPGCTSGPDATTDLARIFWNQLRILGSTMGTNEEFAEVVALYRADKLKPVIDKVYAPEAASEAYGRLESAEQFGKIVVKWT